MASKHVKRSSILLINREIQIKTKMSITLYPLGWLLFTNNPKQKNNVLARM